MFGTNFTLPSVVMCLSFHGPSTTCHSGLLSYVPTDFDWPSRYLYTALAEASLCMSKSPTDPESEVLSQTCWGIGEIWLSSLYVKK